jgi:hypothetical protein
VLGVVARVRGPRRPGRSRRIGGGDAAGDEPAIEGVGVNGAVVADLLGDARED